MITNLENWGDIPVLHISEENFTNNAPVVFFLHGFESAKEHNLHYAYQLVNKGCRVIMPDAHLHGDRDIELDQIQISLRFWEIVLTSIEELGKLKNVLKERGYDNGQKIAVSGTSMGGITTLGCLTAYPWIDAAAIMMGTPGYVNLAKDQMTLVEQRGFKIPMNEEEKKKMFDTLSIFDASKQLEKLENKPLFFWHGMKDEVVPFAPTNKFVEDLIEQYGDAQIEFMKEKSVGHAVSRKGMLRSTEWLANRLA